MLRHGKEGLVGAPEGTSATMLCCVDVAITESVGGSIVWHKLWV